MSAEGFDLLPPALREHVERQQVEHSMIAEARPDTTDDAPGTVRCVFCNGVIESPKNAYRRVTGWERQREQGGTNHVVLREPLDEHACVACVTLRRDGITPGQEKMDV